MRRLTRFPKLIRAHVPVFVLALVATAIAVALAATGGIVSGETEVARDDLPEAGAVAQAVATDLQTDSGPIGTIVASTDFTVNYSSLAQLMEAADVAVRGEIVRVSYLDFNSTAYTRTILKVSECLKGDIKAGQEIAIAEVGGITTMAAVNEGKFGPATAEALTTKVRVLLNGAPLSEVGEECLYFLGLGEIGVLPDVYYVPMGAFQGRFVIRNGMAERFVPLDRPGADYTSLATVESAIDQAVLRDALDK